MCTAPEMLDKYNLHNIDQIDSDVQEIDDDEDWRAAEQSAFERLVDDRTDFISGVEMLDWIKRLEAGEDV